MNYLPWLFLLLWEWTAHSTTEVEDSEVDFLLPELGDVYIAAKPPKMKFPFYKHWAAYNFPMSIVVNA